MTTDTPSFPFCLYGVFAHLPAHRVSLERAQYKCGLVSGAADVGMKRSVTVSLENSSVAVAEALLLLSKKPFVERREPAPRTITKRKKMSLREMCRNDSGGYTMPFSFSGRRLRASDDDQPHSESRTTPAPHSQSDQRIVAAVNECSVPITTFGEVERNPMPKNLSCVGDRREKTSACPTGCNVIALPEMQRQGRGEDDEAAPEGSDGTPTIRSNEEPRVRMSARLFAEEGSSSTAALCPLESFSNVNGTFTYNIGNVRYITKQRPFTITHLEVTILPHLMLRLLTTAAQITYFDILEAIANFAEPVYSEYAIVVLIRGLLKYRYSNDTFLMYTSEDPHFNYVRPRNFFCPMNRIAYPVNRITYENIVHIFGQLFTVYHFTARHYASINSNAEEEKSFVPHPVFLLSYKNHYGGYDFNREHATALLTNASSRQVPAIERIVFNATNAHYCQDVGTHVSGYETMWKLLLVCPTKMSNNCLEVELYFEISM